MFEQLPQEVRTTIYSEFMFKNFLFKFRRFFNFRKDDSHKYLDKDQLSVYKETKT